MKTRSRFCDGCESTRWPHNRRANFMSIIRACLSRRLITRLLQASALAFERDDKPALEFGFRGDGRRLIVVCYDHMLAADSDAFHWSVPGALGAVAPGGSLGCSRRDGPIVGRFATGSMNARCFSSKSFLNTEGLYFQQLRTVLSALVARTDVIKSLSRRLPQYYDEPSQAGAGCSAIRCL